MAHYFPLQISNFLRKKEISYNFSCKQEWSMSKSLQFFMANIIIIMFFLHNRRNYITFINMMNANCIFERPWALRVSME